MANDIITATRTDVATLMNTALAPLNLRDRWCGEIGIARDAAPFVAVDKDDELVALSDDADWIASRARAIEIQNKLPPLTEIEAACKAVDQTLRVKPASAEYQLLATKMLDVLGIKGGDDTGAYTEALAWTLADVWSDYPGAPGWIPIPAFAKEIKRTLADRDSWDHFGRTKRPPIPDIVERCKDYRRDLVYARDSIEMLGRTSRRLDTIIQVVNSYEEDDDWGDDEPQEQSKQ